MIPNENLINKYMTKLDISREEALELIADDEKVDKMTSIKQVNNDLTPEQLKASKESRKADRKPTVYKFDKKNRKENTVKAEIISNIAEFLEKSALNVENLDITNKEKLILFKIGENTYELDLKQKRKAKE